MIHNKTLILLSSGVIALTIFSLNFVLLDNNLELQIDENYFIPNYLPVDIYEDYLASASPSLLDCNPEMQNQTRNLIPIDFQTLKVLPAKYKLNRAVDLSLDLGYVQMEYTFGPCGKEGGPVNPYKGGIQVNVRNYTKLMATALSNSTIATITGLSDAEKIIKHSEIRTQIYENRTETKWNADDRIVTVNGHLATIKEPGYTTDRYWSAETGELLYKEVVTYPGRISFVDKDFKNHYSIKGYFSADELKQMAESID